MDRSDKIEQIAENLISYDPDSVKTIIKDYLDSLDESDLNEYLGW